MAKSSSFFGLRRGSTKSLTFSIYRGKQVTKDRVVQVSNPQSLPQMDQRLVLPIVANARARLAGLVNHSFEGVAYGYQSLNHFNSINLAKGALNIVGYVPKGGASCGIANLKVSDGSLPVITGDMTQTDLVGEFTPLYPDKGLSEPSTKIFPVMPDDTKGSTVLYYFFKALAGLGISDFTPGSQLTVLQQVAQAKATYKKADGTTKDYWRYAFGILRAIYPTDYPTKADGSLLTVDELKDYHDDNDVFKLASVVPSGGTNWVILQTEQGMSLQIGFTKLTSDGSAEFGFAANCDVFTDDHSGVISQAVIFSQKDGNVWRRSPARLQLYQPLNYLTRDDVLPSYLKAGATSTKYLNTGNAAVGIIGGSTVSTSNPGTSADAKGTATTKASTASGGENNTSNPK